MFNKTYKMFYNIDSTKGAPFVKYSARITVGIYLSRQNSYFTFACFDCYVQLCQLL